MHKLPHGSASTSGKRGVFGELDGSFSQRIRDKSGCDPDWWSERRLGLATAKRLSDERLPWCPVGHRAYKL